MVFIDEIRHKTSMGCWNDVYRGVGELSITLRYIRIHAGHLKLIMYNYFRDSVTSILSLPKEPSNIFTLKLKPTLSGSITYDLKDCPVNKHLHFNHLVKRAWQLQFSLCVLFIRSNLFEICFCLFQTYFQMRN